MLFWLRMCVGFCLVGIEVVVVDLGEWKWKKRIEIGVGE